ncbi:MAG: hypothetical protein WBA88_26260, partial [Pseudaminobacter sp.]
CSIQSHSHESVGPRGLFAPTAIGPDPTSAFPFRVAAAVLLACLAFLNAPSGAAKTVNITLHDQPLHMEMLGEVRANRSL